MAESVFHTTLEHEGVAEFDRLMGINPNIVRYLITRAEELEASQGAKK